MTPNKPAAAPAPASDIPMVAAIAAIANIYAAAAAALDKEKRRG